MQYTSRVQLILCQIGVDPGFWCRGVQTRTKKKSYSRGLDATLIFAEKTTFKVLYVKWCMTLKKILGGGNHKNPSSHSVDP